MNKIYTVCEYDNLIRASEDQKEDPSTIEKDHKIVEAVYDELRDYLLSSLKDDKAQMFKVAKLGSKKGMGEVIRLQNYVGVISLPSGARFEVLPKIYAGDDALNKVNDIKNILLSMLSTLKDFPAIELDSTSLGLANMSIYEIFVRIYLRRVLSLVKRGLKSEYSLVEENSLSYKGRLLVSEQIKFNSAHEERFYMQKEVYDLDRHENRLIKSALKKLLRGSDDFENIRLARRLLCDFDSVPESMDYERDYASIVFDNGNKEYLDIIQWSMVFLRNKTFSLFDEKTNGQALLFPMEKVFEAYIANRLSDVVRLYNKQNGLNWRVLCQERAKYLFDIPKAFKIRPDIHIENGQNVLLDTKWKLLSKSESKNGISQGDMYQMYAYSKRYQASQVYLLYPHTPIEGSIRYKSYRTDERANPTRVDLKFMDLDNIVKLSGKASDKLSDKYCLYGLISEIEQINPGIAELNLLTSI